MNLKNSKPGTGRGMSPAFFLKVRAGLVWGGIMTGKSVKDQFLGVYLGVFRNQRHSIE